VREVGERVDHRHRRVRGQLRHDPVRERADHDQIAHAGQHVRDVLQALAAVLRHLDRAEIDDVAAQLVHARR
jgi:DNA-binding MurR/RpiR family transcriptional regulator